MTTTAQEVKMLQVSTVPAVLVAKGMIQITASTRATKGEDGTKKTIAADQRSRSILIPEFTPAVSSKYASIVSVALTNAAMEQLRQQWKQEPMLREVAAALYSEDSILAFCAREAESKKLSGETILAWFDQSELCKHLAAQLKEGKITEPQLKKLRTELENIAAPVLSLYTEEKALKRIAMLGKFEGDLDHDVCAACVAKLTRYIDGIKKMRDDIGSVEDIELA